MPNVLGRRLKESFRVELKDESLLRLALVHSSYLNENPDEFDESNERLEFLGDAVIGLGSRGGALLSTAKVSRKAGSPR